MRHARGHTFAPKSTIIDTNLLLLLLVGTFDLQRIKKFKRTQQFSESDFDLLVNFLKPVKKIITTPHILTEVSNLAGQMDGRLLSTFYAVFAQFVQRFEEHSERAKSLVTGDMFSVFGLTDAAIGAACHPSVRVLTDDAQLASALAGKGIDVLSFDVLRNIADASSPG